LVIRNHKAKAFVFLVVSDNLGVGVFQNPDNDSLCPPSRAFVFYDNLDSVTMKRAFRMFFRNENILFPPFHGDKSKSSGMAGKNTVYGKSLRLAVFSLFGKSGLSLSHQDIQNLLKFFSLALGNV